MIRKALTSFILLLPLVLFSQNKEVVSWINNNSIEIEDANPNSELEIFKHNTPNKFADAKIYGFGEASHNTKEFFDLKAKFFKHMVINHGVKVFVMEDSYQSESAIDEWIRGGKGDINTIAENFSIGFWRTKEIVNLLQWMRDYNKTKSQDEQIRYYGMDIQVGKKINEEIRQFVIKNSLTIDEELLTIADDCANRTVDFSKKDDWWQTKIPSLIELKHQLLNQKLESKELKSIIRSLEYLTSYVGYASVVNDKYPKSTEFRDLKMYENVRYIIENESKNGKAFIWAHNEHINKREMYYAGSNIITLGRHLKDFYKEDYYSVGFDFGVGTITGVVSDKNKGDYWKTYQIKKPFKGTYANTLFLVDKNIYFIELDEKSKFFNEKSRSLIIGGGGYDPNPLYKILVSKVYSETYDGLIFVKNISVPDYNLN